MYEKTLTDAKARNLWFGVLGLRLWTYIMNNKYSNGHLKDVPCKLSLGSNDAIQGCEQRVGT